MKKDYFLIPALIAICFAMYVTSCSDSNQSIEEDSTKIEEPSPEEIIERGKYLVTIMGCNDCHSPKRMGPNGPELIPEMMLGGYPADQGIPAFDSKLTDQGYALFLPDLTAAKGPWGISFAANLTPDDTGIKSWSEDQFKKALTKGLYKGLDGSRPLLPPMPWVNYINMTDEDVHATFMYLKSVAPVKNQVPEPIAPDTIE